MGASSWGEIHTSLGKNERDLELLLASGFALALASPFLLLSLFVSHCLCRAWLRVAACVSHLPLPISPSLASYALLVVPQHDLPPPLLRFAPCPPLSAPPLLPALLI